MYTFTRSELLQEVEKMSKENFSFKKIIDLNGGNPPEKLFLIAQKRLEIKSASLTEV